jgi:hypothetical protein
MSKIDFVPSDVEQFRLKGRELVALAISLAACHDKMSAPRSPIFTIRRRAIVLLEGAISFVEFFLRLRNGGDGSADVND